MRTCGFDGTAIRGVHAKTFCIMDEAPKVKNDAVFKEFWGRGEPGAVFKLYGMPDGDRSCVFYKLTAKAEGKLRADEEEPSGKLPEFRLFKWAKHLQPFPYWSDQRRREYIDRFGGEDSPGYRQGVLGEWGDPENSVFPWFQFQRLLKVIPEYRCLKILVDDACNEVSVYGSELGREATGAEARPEP